MMFPMIRPYHHWAPFPPNTFYLVADGEEAGRPVLEPVANGYVVICPHQRYFEFYFWLLHGLHMFERFKKRHPLAPAPYIKLEEVRDTLRHLAPLVYKEWERLFELTDYLDKSSKKKTLLPQRVDASENLFKTLLPLYLDSTPKSGLEKMALRKLRSEP